MNQATFEYVPDEAPAEQEKQPRQNTGNHPDPMEQASADETLEKASAAAQEHDKEKSESAGELIALDKINPIQVFSTEKGLDPLIQRIKAEVEKEVLDPSDDAGRTRIRSLARKIGGAKMRLKEMGQGLTEDWRQKTKAVTTETSRMEKEIDAIRDAVLKPLEEYEARAAERKAKFENRINEILTAADFFEPLTADELKARIDKITVLYKYEWEEFEVRATQAWEQVKPKLDKLLGERTKYESDQAELERLRKEEEDRLKKEREEKIAAEAAEKAKKEAEEKAAAEAAAAEAKAKAEQDRLQREKDEAERKAKEAAERAEREKTEAVEAERKRQKDEADKAEAERQKREADKKHRKDIQQQVYGAINDVMVNSQPHQFAEKMVEALDAGKIPHVKIEY